MPELRTDVLIDRIQRLVHEQTRKGESSELSVAAIALCEEFKVTRKLALVCVDTIHGMTKFSGDGEAWRKEVFERMGWNE